MARMQPIVPTGSVYEWNRYTYSYQNLSDKPSLLIVLRFRTIGTCWRDEVSVTFVGDGWNVLKDRSQWLKYVALFCMIRDHLGHHRLPSTSMIWYPCTVFTSGDKMGLSTVEGVNANAASWNGPFEIKMKTNPLSRWKTDETYDHASTDHPPQTTTRCKYNMLTSLAPQVPTH